jgi:hypothetical protein
LYSGTIDLLNITSPANVTSFYVRARIAGDAWVTSSLAYSHNADIQVLTVAADYHWDLNSSYVVHSLIHNLGISGSATIEWDIVNASTLAIYSSGTTETGNVSPGPDVTIHLTGIVSPDFENITVKVRARTIGASEWTYSSNILVITYSPPENPDPRGLPL